MNRMRCIRIPRLCIILICIISFCFVLAQGTICHAEPLFPRGDKKWLEGYNIFKERYAIIMQRYREVFEPATPADGWPPSRYVHNTQYTMLNYRHEPDYMDNLKPDLYLEDFLSIEVGKTTLDGMWEAVGIAHMSYGSGPFGAIYLTADGYYIAYDFTKVNSELTISKGYIQHVDWKDDRDLETFRLETLAQLDKQAQILQLKQMLMQYIPVAAIVITAAVLLIICAKRKRAHDG